MNIFMLSSFEILISFCCVALLYDNNAIQLFISRKAAKEQRRKVFLAPYLLCAFA